MNSGILRAAGHMLKAFGLAAFSGEAEDEAEESPAPRRSGTRRSRAKRTKAGSDCCTAKRSVPAVRPSGSGSKD